MDSTIVGMTLAGAVFAFALISNSRTQDIRRREAEFLARHLRAGRRVNGRLLLTGPG
jgi:hypothetical protein